MKNILIIASLFIMSAFAPAEEKIDVIVNSQNVVTQLSISEVRIYWMRRPKKRWEGSDKNIKPVDFKGDTPAKKQFYKIILKLSESDVENYFTAKQYQSGELPPAKLDSDKDVIGYVGSEIGSIGFVRHNTLSEEDLKKVKVVYSFGVN
jgi:hypothetical protein